MSSPPVVVAAAILRGQGGSLQVLAAQRAAPPSLAGRWEFVGGKVEQAEGEQDALRRECREELGVEIVVLDRLGGDVLIAAGGAVLRVWTARITAGLPAAREHRQLRWLSASTVYDVEWLPADLPVVAALPAILLG